MNAHDVLKNLQAKRNVLLMGAPGTGKSKLLNDVALMFMKGEGINPTPKHDPESEIPIPAVPKTNIIGNLPMMKRTNRKVFRTTLHQNSKFRDFLTGITPQIKKGQAEYKISEGILYRANEFAKHDDSAALLIIDELNRGPAIEVFGGSIVTIEPDKRLGEDNQPTENTQFFEIVSPETGDYIEYAFSPHLYILAAMNQADVSVAPLDVAFMRRWMSMMLLPDYSCVYDKFNIKEGKQNIVKDWTTATAKDIYYVAIKGLEAVNKKIKVGRGAEYQLGQGVFLSTEPRGNSNIDALDFIADAWAMIYAHIEELFFGEPNSIAYVLNAGRKGSPYSRETVDFAGETKFIISCSTIDRDTIYGLYLSLLEEDDPQ